MAVWVVLTPGLGACVARLRGGGWGRAVSAPRGAVAPCGPFVHLALIHRCWVDDLGSVRYPQPVGHLVQFTLKPGGLFCSSGGSGGGGGGGGGDGGGHFSELLLELGNGGGGSFGGGGVGGGVFSRANSTTLLAASALSRSRSVSRSACLPAAASSVTLNCGRTGIEANAALALEVVDDGVGCGRLGRGAAKDGAEARRNGAGARASLRQQVDGGLERSEHGVAVDGVGGRRAARLAEASRAL